MRLDGACFLHCLEQIVFQWELPEIAFLEADEFLAEFLPCQVFALLRAFAGL